MVARPTASPMKPAAKTLSWNAGSAAIRAPAPVAAASPPTKPDHVLLGENRGHSLGPFKVLPTANAPISAAQVAAKSIIVHQCPWFVDRSHTRQSAAGAM